VAELDFMTRLKARGLKKGPRPDGRPNAWVLLAAWGPCGYAPVAPGTFGTAGAIPLFWLMRDLPLGLYAAITVGIIAVGSVAAHFAGRYWKVVDASPIVIDEVAGYLVTMALIPWSFSAAILGFFWFRVFDIVKPWPASLFDGMKNGFGVVMDDVAAGVFAWAAMQMSFLALQLVFGCHAGEVSFFCAQLTP
jgi:phosphatidylglycerophosphatase A